MAEPEGAERSVNPSPFRELLGLRIASLEPGRAMLTLAVTPALMNFAGTLNGGVVASMIDMAGALSGCHSDDPARRRTAITLMFSTCFVGSATAGEVTAIGTRQGGGRQIFTAAVEVFDGEGRLIATGQGSYRYVAGSEGR